MPSKSKRKRTRNGSLATVGFRSFAFNAQHACCVSELRGLVNGQLQWRLHNIERDDELFRRQRGNVVAAQGALDACAVE